MLKFSQWGGNLKIIHCADIHLGSKINSTLAGIGHERRTDVRNTFMRMCEYARKNDIHIILLAGDVFDSDIPLKKDKDNFYMTIRNYPEIDFLYLKGNHDTKASCVDVPLNLKCFSDTWTKYQYGNVVISGLEITGANQNSFYDTLNLKEENLNIVMLHGMVSDTEGINQIKLKQLRDKHIDYLALGHIHTYKEYKLDSRGWACYSGCIEGRGFDETDEKGFVVLDIENSISYKFIPFSYRVIHSFELDITGALTVNDVVCKINQKIVFKDKDIYRLILKGEVSPELDLTDTDIESYYSNVYYIKVYIDTTLMVDLEAFKNDISIKGEFVRTVLNDDKISEQEKNEIISLGLKTLAGGFKEIYENN